jgi:lysophospholipase
MRAVEAYLQAEDGVGLFVRRFEPRTRDADRWLVLVHGMSEHGQCYEHVARSAVARGWNVVVPDLRGHGRSGGEHIHVNDFSEYVADLRRIFEWGRLVSHKTVIVGHSMGGLISARFVQQFPDYVSALALISPLLGVQVKVNPLTVALARVLSVVRPKSRFRKKIDPAYSSRNPAALLRGAQDPLIRQSLTAAWYFAMRAALRTVWDLAERIACPLLVLQAGSDQIVDPRAPHSWIERVGSLDKTLRVLPDHYHELLNELDWANTLADLLDWLELRILQQAAVSAALVAASLATASLGTAATIPLRETA